MSTIKELIGLTLSSIENRENKELVFRASNGREFVMYHDQDCCEDVWIEDIVGDLTDLIGSPILEAEEASNSSDPPAEDRPDSYTWTYYKLGTVKGHVNIRWYGSSNGYYSEEVSFREQVA